MHLKKSRSTERAPSARQGHAPPEVETRRQEGTLSICLKGDWTIRTMRQSTEKLAALDKTPGQSLAAALDITDVDQLDTSGALLINRLRGRLSSRGDKIPLSGLDERKKALLEVAALPEDGAADATTHRRPGLVEALARPLNRIGAKAAGQADNALGMLNFLGLFLASLCRSLLKPWSIRWTSLVYHMGQAGVGALPIASLLSFLIGMVLAYMSASQLAMFGAEIFVVKLLEVGVLREMAVLITAILIAGRSGSSFTAQIGSMKANEEIDAMRSMGIDPVDTLVLPRVMALCLMLPILVLAADIAGILGGMMAVWLSLDITPRLFIDTLQQRMSFSHLFVGLFKAPFFAVVIGCVGCHCGFMAGSSSDSVGRMTTKAVVDSIFLVITLDAVFALCYITLKI